MRSVNTIVLDMNNENFKKDISDIIDILIRNKYEISLRADVEGFVEIKFDYNKSENMGNPYISWILEEEEMAIEEFSETPVDSSSESKLFDGIDPEYFFDCKRG